ncbi:glycosyltransferase [Tianweitania sediminis]|uniref:Glycosyltransferase n=1 Tax=Tianweitania sediminis TaxID=1502156 RepID=A0A8J7R1P1_9HYPH|nr:glycosyltransferase [Tianweitania sediminis]MBP0438580.1 glycosyltransferase [Tianweitania sediminis]
MTDALGGQFDFHLLARDRPFRAEEGCASRRTADRFTASYLRAGSGLPLRLLQTIHGLAPDLVWLNGFFDREFTLPLLLARRGGLLPGMSVLLSPRGEFNPGALAQKPRRKQAFVAFATRGRLLQTVALHATGALEENACRTLFPAHRTLQSAGNIRPLLVPLPHVPGDKVRLAFLGRITPVKNLHLALEVLAGATIPLQFDIYGPSEDAGYLQTCRALAERLPPHVQASFKGVLPQQQLATVLAETDLLFLPSAGENFGHAIFEALSCGVPVLISDQTPWTSLRLNGAGWDLPLGKKADFLEAIQAFAGYDEGTRLSMRANARALAEDHHRRNDAVSRTEIMLRELCAA